MLGSIEEFLLDTEPQIETLIKTLSASPTDAAIAPSAYMKLVELFNKVFILLIRYKCRSVILGKSLSINKTIFYNPIRPISQHTYVVAPSANIDTSFDIDTQILLKRSLMCITKAYYFRLPANNRSSTAGLGWFARLWFC